MSTRSTVLLHERCNSTQGYIRTLSVCFDMQIPRTRARVSTHDFLFPDDNISRKGMPDGRCGSRCLHAGWSFATLPQLLRVLTVQPGCRLRRSLSDVWLACSWWFISARNRDAPLARGLLSPQLRLQQRTPLPVASWNVQGMCVHKPCAPSRTSRSEPCEHPCLDGRHDA